MQGVGRRKIAHIPPSSDELIEIYRQSGRPEDFEQIVRRFAALVLSECRRVTANVHDAEDASQLVFLALAMQIKSGDPIKQLPSWLSRVAQRHAMKIVRTRARFRRREDAARRSELYVTDLSGELDATATAGIVRDAIDQLPERYRLPVILHYFGGMHLERVAVELKLKRQAVATRLHRGRKMLAAQLEQQGLKLDDKMLAALLGILVPSAVVSSVVTSVHGATSAASASAAAAALPTAIGDTLRVLAFGGALRPMRVVAAAGILLFGGSTMAWVVGPEALGLPKLRLFDGTRMIERLLDIGPRPRVNASNEDVKPATTPASVDMSPPVVVSTPARALSPPVATAPAQPVTVPPPPIASNETKPTAPAGGRPMRKQDEAPPPKRDVAAPKNLIVADAAQAVYEFDQQRLEVERLSIGGEYHVGDSEIVVTSPGGITVGERGPATLYIGNENLPGRIIAAPGVSAPFTIRATPEGRGVVQGWGTINTGGRLINNGQVIADGFDHNRELDLSGFEEVDNTIDNLEDGANGWFVQRGGQIRLPPLMIKPGTHSYTWGERPDAPLDLINSLRLRVHDQPTAAALSIALRTVALADPLDITLPGGVSIIGLWEFDAISFDPSQLDVLVRYNDLAANTFFPGEDALQMLGFDGEWRLADNIDRDLLANYISGEFPGAIEYLAVAIPWNINLPFTPSGAAEIAGSGVVPVPEPAGVTLIVIGVAMILSRRTRRRSRDDLIAPAHSAV